MSPAVQTGLLATGRPLESLHHYGKVFRVRQAWVPTPALVDLPPCISLGNLLYLSGLSFFISKMRIISTHL